jgi:hypothetical protein
MTFDRLMTEVVYEYMRWLYAAPGFTLAFSLFFVGVLSLTLVDAAFWIARKVVR